MSRTGAPRIFEPDYYQRLHDIEERHWWSRGMRRAMSILLGEALGGRRSLRVLDVGCGTGYLLQQLRELGLAARPAGVDISVHALAHCRHRELATAAAASAVRLPFGPESFDLVLCLDTLQHLSPEGADRLALAELERVLAPGGVLYLLTNAACGHRRLTGVDPDLYRRYDRRTLIEAVRSTDLEVERATYLNAVPSLWQMLKELLDPRSGRVPPSGPTLTIRAPRRESRWLGRLLYGILCLEASWLRLGPTLPFGHSLALVARRRR